MKVRLQKFLSSCGIASRRKCEEFILQGRVKVNSKIVTALGTKIDPEKDTVSFNNKPVRKIRENIYIAFNKPEKCIVSNFDPQGRKTVFDYIKNIDQRLFAIGRLDYNSRGLLLLTNDGEFAHKVQHPSQNIIKEYDVKIRGTITQDDIKKLTEGILIDTKKTSPALVEVIKRNPKSTRLRFVISEGRYRQIRRMLEELGYNVADLKRISIGDVTLGVLEEGEFRFLTKSEIISLIRRRKDIYGLRKFKK